MNLLPKDWLRRLARQALAWAGMHPGDGAASSYFFNGEEIDEQAATALTAVTAAVRVISESLASLPLKVYEQTKTGEKKELRNIPEWGVLHDNTKTRETLIAHAVGWGNGFVELLFDNFGSVVGWQNLAPAEWYAAWNEQGDVEYRSRRDSRIKLDSSRIVHLAGLSFDGLNGYNPIRAHNKSIQLAKAAEDYGAAFYNNNSVPNGVLKHPQQLSPGAAKKLKREFRELHQGANNAFNIAVLEEGVEFEPIAISNDDAEFIATRKFQVIEIARMFRVPPHLLYDLERATFSNIEAQSIEFVVHTLRPWAVRLEQELWKKFFDSNPSVVVEHVFDGLLRGDSKTRYETYAIGRQWGWLSANDIRALENMNPIPGGDRYLEPLNMGAKEGGNGRSIVVAK